MPFRPAAAACAAFALAAAPIAAARADTEAVLARYDVQAGGVSVMRAEVLFELSGPRYRVRMVTRPVGVGAVFAGGGEQVSTTEGSWRGADPQPRRFSSDGEWRGGRRAVQLDYAPASDAAPLVRTLEPPMEADREPVPDSLRRGTMDGLSAMAKLLRVAAQTGRCDGDAPVYDGRRRSDFRAWTVRTEDLPRGEGAFSGPALRCGFLGHTVAGRQASQARRERDAGPPQPMVAWVARPVAGRAAVPVLIEMPTRWFGTLRVVLASAEPADR